MINFITTFYSFKGGVGRTLLLTNVGAILAAPDYGYNRKVLLCDLDLEAPGLHHIPDLELESPPAEGFMEWLLNDWYRSQSIAQLPSDASLDHLLNRIKPTKRLKNLHILPAYGENADFARLYQDIPWNEFMIERPDAGLQLFRKVLNYLAERGRYHHILLDARTGITDLGGLMAAILPNATVLISNYSAQSMAGLLHIYNALQPAVEGRLPARAQQAPLHRLLVVSPVPQDQKLLQKLKQESLYKTFSIPPSYNLIEVPFESSLLFGEQLLVLNKPESEAARTYKRVAQNLDTLRTDLEEAQYSEGQEKVGRVAFTEEISTLLRLMDYRVEVENFEESSNIYLSATRKAGLRSEYFIIECRKWTKPISKGQLEDFQRFHENLQRPGSDGMFVALEFSDEARDYAKKNNILVYTPNELEFDLFDFSLYLERLLRNFEESQLAQTYVLQRIKSISQQFPFSPNTTDEDYLLNYAKAWVRGETGKRLWVLLGDYGIGKTTFFKRLAYQMAKDALENIAMPAPIAIELREYPNVSSLETLLQEHLRKVANWHGNPKSLLHLMARGRVVLLLDAFDEIYHYNPVHKADELLGELIKPAAYEGHKPSSNRILMTCGTQFFRDHPADGPTRLEQLTHNFDAEIDEFEPFNDTQISKFLELKLGKDKTEMALKVINDARFSLSNLATQPKLLEMIVSMLPKLESQNGYFNATKVYLNYVDQWLKIRNSNIKTSVDQRCRIVEELASTLWQRNQQYIFVNEFKAILRESSDKFDTLDIDNLDLELCTAPFLNRTLKGIYSFSHRQFLDFFYALNIRRILREHSSEALKKILGSVRLTEGAVRFLADGLLELDDVENVAQFICSVLTDSFQQGLSENVLLFAYDYARFIAKDVRNELKECMMRFIPRGSHLEDADLRGICLNHAFLNDVILRRAQLQGTELSGASLKDSILVSANLEGARLTNAELINAQLNGANLRCVEAINADFTHAQLTGADLTGACMVGSDCTDARLAKANCYATRFAKARLDNVDWRQARTSRLTAPGASGITAQQPAHFKLIPENIIPFPQVGHASPLSYAVFSRDGRRVLTADEDGSLRLWDTETGEELRLYEGHFKKINTAVFGGNNGQVEDAYILTASDDGSVCLWDAQTAAKLYCLRGQSRFIRFNSAVFSSDGLQILGAGSDGTLHLWKTSDGSEKWNSGAGAGNLAIMATTFTNNNSRILTCDIKGNVYSFNAINGKKVHLLSSYNYNVQAAAFSPDGTKLMIAADDDIIYLCDPTNSSIITSFTEHNKRISTVAFHIDGKQAISASYDGSARLWDTEIGKKVKCFTSHGSWVHSAILSNDGRKLLTTGEDGIAYLWDSLEGKEIRRFQGRGTKVLGVTFSCNDKWLVTAHSDHSIRLWNLEEGRQNYLFEGLGKTMLQPMMLSSDGRYLLYIDRRDATSVCLRDLQYSQDTFLYTGHKEQINTASLSPQENWVLTASDDHSACLWKGKPAEIIHRFQMACSIIIATFSISSPQILTAGENDIAVWDKNNGQKIFSKHITEEIVDAQFGPGRGQISMILKDHNSYKLLIFDINRRRRIKSISIPPKNSQADNRIIKFSPGGKLFLISYGNGIVDLESFNIKNGQLLLLYTYTLIAVRGGWLSLTAEGFYQGDNKGIDCLSYRDPEEHALLPTLWKAEDLGERRRQ